MKKVVIVVCLSILCISSGFVYAADSLYRMLHANEVDAFKKDQDAIIVGQIINDLGDKFNVKVIKVISGKVNPDAINVAKDLTYGWGETGLVPAVNDFFVMSLKKSGVNYKNAWGIFKADSGDYRTLKLSTANASSTGLLGDLACIEWYVNSGGTENDFSFSNSVAYIKRPNGKVVQIYPKPVSNEAKATGNKTQTEKADTNAKTDNSKTFLTGGALILFIIVLEILTQKYLNSRKRKQ